MKRNKRRRYRFPRNIRLAISCSILVLLLLGIVLIVRGCSGSGSPDALDAGSPSVAPSASPAVQSPDNTDGTAPEASPEPDASYPSGADAFVDEAPAATPKPGGRSVTIRSIGDIVADTAILSAAKNDAGYDFAPMLSLIKESMGKADYTVLNVDGPLGGKGERGYKGYPQFNTPPYLIDALKDAGVDMLTLSNNHALDTFFDGLKRTVDNVESVGLDHIGAYRSQEEYDKPYIKEIGGIDIGFLNYGTTLNNLEKHSDKAAVEYGLRLTRNSNAEEDIKKLREAGAEAVVVYMHWGEEYKLTPESSTRTMANKLAQYGADVIVGGHSHTVQPAEWITTTDATGASRRTLVLYSMGNFLTEHRTDNTDSGIIFEFTLASNDQTGAIEVVAPKYIPVYVWRTGDKGSYDYRVLAIGDYIDNRPTSMDDENYQRMQKALSHLQTQMGTAVATLTRN